MDHVVEIIEELTLASSAQRVFAQVTSPAGMLLFRGFGMIPGIARVEPGAHLRAVGVEDVVHNDDGTSHRERVVEHAPCAAYALRIGPFDAPMRHLVTYLDERWEFAPEGSGTRVRRTFRFTSRGPLASLVVRLVVAPQMRIAMRRNHAALRAQLGAGQPIT